jgi:RNA polymerase sigma factor (sigma-70 family)
MTSDAKRSQAMPIDGPRTSPDSLETLETLYLAHATALRGRLLALTRDPAVAEDLASEAFLRLAVELGAGRAPLDARAWLYRVGSNLVISRARRTNVATRAMPGLLDRDLAASPEDEVIEHERDDLLRDAVATLAGRDRQVVVLAAQGYRTEEIAGIIGCTGPATRTRLCRARGRLRSRLELAGMTA